MGEVSDLREPEFLSEGAGAQDNYFRTYDPATGRYLEADPIGLRGGLNTYTYVFGNPLNRIDPLGLASCTYSISNHTATCVSDSGATATVGPTGVFSGQDECRDNPECSDQKDQGPVPPGTYDMVPSAKYGGSYWLKQGWVTRQLYKVGIGRSEFFFHKGTISLGCITVDPSLANDFNAIHDVLADPSPDTMTVVP